MTIDLSEQMDRESRRHKAVNWAEVARPAIAWEVDQLEKHDRLLAKSQLAEADAVELGRAIRRRGAPRQR